MRGQPDRKTAFSHAGPRNFDFLGKLEKEAAYLQSVGKTGQVHLCFTTDPYQALEDAYQYTHDTIRILHEHGFSVAILSKGGKRALKDLDMFGPKDAYAITLVFATDKDSQRWEPNAASPQERFDTLKAFHDKGIPTWVSMEPVIDPNQTLYMIELTAPWVDHFKVGKLNHNPDIERTIDWKKFGNDAIKKLEGLGYSRIMNPDDGKQARGDTKLFYIKDALRKEMER
jgi:hypothetical protein